MIRTGSLCFGISNASSGTTPATGPIRTIPILAGALHGGYLISLTFHTHTCEVKCSYRPAGLLPITPSLCGSTEKLVSIRKIISDYRIFTMQGKRP